MAQIQANRQAQFLIDDQDEDFLVLQRLEGSEGISELFEFQLVVLGDKQSRADVDLNELLGQHAQVELECSPGGKRWFSGYITSMSFVGFRDEELAIYQLRLRPWLWFLTRTRNSRIFQNLTVPEIIKQVLDGHGLSDYEDELGYEEYQTRDYCVQYRESDFDFISRLMEEEGIHYYFHHKDGKHVLIMADDFTVHEHLSAAHNGVSAQMDEVVWDPDPEGGPGLHIHDWRMQRQLRIESVELRDFNHMQPNLMIAKSRVEEKEVFAGPGSVSLEHYDYPGRFPEYASQSASSDLTRVAAIRKEEMQTEFEVLAGQGRIRTLVPGFQFRLANHDRADQEREYLVSTTHHELTLPEYDHSGSNSSNAIDYKVDLTAVPSGITYRPRQNTPQPIVHGPQTAMVVGPAGQEIDIDDHGRVKIQFHWDREGENDENSSCRVRVSQAWAGKGWGAFFFPRIGHEVIVEFLEGNPDRPIITGAVYNGENRPPFDENTQSGIKTRSTPSGTGDNFNEIRFEDKCGEEKISIHAEKDLDISVENDRDELVEGNESVEVRMNRDHTVKCNDTRTVDGDDCETIKGDQTVTVEGDRTFRVKGDENRDVDGEQIENVVGKWRKDVDGKIKIKSKKDIDIESDTQISLTDCNHVHFGDFSLNFQGSTIGISGQSIDFKGNAVGTTAVNADFRLVDMGVTGVEVKKTLVQVYLKDVETSAKKVSLKKVLMSLKKKEVDLSSEDLQWQNSALYVQS